MTDLFADGEIAREYPMPLECHPAYTDKQQWIVGWLDDPCYAHDHLRIASMPVELLTRKRCAALAPWTEQPFHYEWWVAVDTHSRWVAGDARIVPDQSEPIS